MPMLNSIYRGSVVNCMDPLKQSRVQVRCEAVLGAATNWAETCLPPGFAASSAGYRVGDRVWICFEGGDASRPVVLGKMGA